MILKNALKYLLTASNLGFQRFCGGCFKYVRFFFSFGKIFQLRRE